MYYVPYGINKLYAYAIYNKPISYRFLDQVILPNPSIQGSGKYLHFSLYNSSHGPHIARVPQVALPSLKLLSVVKYIKFYYVLRRRRISGLSVVPNSNAGHIMF